MGRYIVKPHKDIDLYVEWSSIVDAPTFLGSRQEITPYLMRGDRQGTSTAEEVVERLNRTDDRGSSLLDHNSEYWDDEGCIPATHKGQRWLRRVRFGAYCLLVAAGDEEGAYLLTEPLDDDDPVVPDVAG